MLPGIYRSATILVAAIIFYAVDIFLIKRYDPRREYGSSRNRVYTLAMVAVLLFILVQPLAWPQLGLDIDAWWGPLIQVVGVVLIFLGLALHWWARTHLCEFYAERSSDIQAGQHVVDSGPYRYVRHPIYSSYFVIAIGFALVNPALPTLLLLAYTLVDFSLAPIREERLLVKNVPGYAEYRDRTPLFFPRFRRSKTNPIESPNVDRSDEMKGIIGQLLDVSSTDPDDRRRARLLNILLLGLVMLTVLAAVAATLAYLAGVLDVQRMIAICASSLVMVAGCVVILLINRYWSGRLASWLFLLLLTVLLASTDQPQEVADGRSLFVFAIPIVMSSVLLQPSASFAMTALTSLLIAAIGLSVQLVPNVFAMLVFFALALVSWLSARSLERALKDLRVLNLELDQRVRDRTRDLAEALSRNEAILEGIADGVIVFDNQRRAILSNPAIETLLGRSVNEVLGHDVEAVMVDKVSVEAQREVLALLSGGMHTPSIKFEWGDKTLSASVAPVRLASEETIGTVIVFRDFTREAELDRMKSAFVSMTSHELRTPLNAIIGYADMLQEAVYGPLSDGQRKAVTRIVSNSNELLGLVNNLLDQAQIEAGTLTLNVASFELPHLLDDVVDGMKVLAQARGLELTSRIEPDVPTTLSGDQQRLRQILINLAGNAIKFTDEGVVRMRVYRPDGTHWAMEVSDTGRGISPSAQEYIFEPFRRADDPTMRKRVGAGLGLSITKQLVTLMDGTIGLASQVGHGSTFTVVLPIVPA